jgi:hypothetical protein
MGDHKVTWIGGDREPRLPPNPAFPNGQDVNFAGKDGGGAMSRHVGRHPYRSPGDLHGVRDALGGYGGHLYYGQQAPGA